MTLRALNLSYNQTRNPKMITRPSQRICWDDMRAFAALSPCISARTLNGKYFPIWLVMDLNVSVSIFQPLPICCDVDKVWCQVQHVRMRKQLRECAMRSDDVSGFIALAEYWTYECIRNHGECYFEKDVRDSSEMPHRLVELCNFSPNSAKSFLKVVDTGGRCRRYAALSYKWQPTKSILAPMKLSKENQVSLYAGFPPWWLSKSIQSACRLAKGMGIRYLWVDALVSELGMRCIISLII